MFLFNTHTHRKARAGEIVIRNAYHYPSKPGPLGTYYSVGIHPWGLSQARLNGTIERIDELATRNEVVAIGEIGLDYLFPEKVKQQEFFIRQLELAEKHRLPVIIHCVKAMHDLLPILKRHSVQAVLHNFYANETITAKCLENQRIYFSFGKRYLKAQKEARENYKAIPLNRILFETDQLNIPIAEMYQTYSQENKKDYLELIYSVAETATLLYPKIWINSNGNHPENLRGKQNPDPGS